MLQDAMCMLCFCTRRRRKQLKEQCENLDRYLIQMKYESTPFTEKPGYQLKYCFPNNYCVSVVKTWCSVGAKDGCWEVAVIDTDGKFMTIDEISLKAFGEKKSEDELIIPSLMQNIHDRS